MLPALALRKLLARAYDDLPCRLLLDNVWQRFTSLGSPGRASISSNELDRVSSISGTIEDFQTPQATVTTVLVLGATGK